MAHLQYYNYPGWGTWAAENMNYAQTVRVGDVIKISGQGGWDGSASDFDPASPSMFGDSLAAEIDRAFANVDLALKHAGGKGWSQVYLVRTYNTDIAAEHEMTVANFKKWMPDHMPVWTQLGVGHLGGKHMHIEIEVEAHVG